MRFAKRWAALLLVCVVLCVGGLYLFNPGWVARSGHAGAHNKAVARLQQFFEDWAQNRQDNLEETKQDTSSKGAAINSARSQEIGVLRSPPDYRPPS